MDDRKIESAETRREAKPFGAMMDEAILSLIRTYPDDEAKADGRRRTLRTWRMERGWTIDSASLRSGLIPARWLEIEEGRGPEPTEEEADLMRTALGQGRPLPVGGETRPTMMQPREVLFEIQRLAGQEGRVSADCCQACGDGVAWIVLAEQVHYTTVRAIQEMLSSFVGRNLIPYRIVFLDQGAIPASIPRQCYEVSGGILSGFGPLCADCRMSLVEDVRETVVAWIREQQARVSPRAKVDASFRAWRSEFLDRLEAESLTVDDVGDWIDEYVPRRESEPFGAEVAEAILGRGRCPLDADLVSLAERAFAALSA